MTNDCGSVNKAHNTQGIGEKKYGFPTYADVLVGQTEVTTRTRKRPTEPRRSRLERAAALRQLRRVVFGMMGSRHTNFKTKLRRQLLII